MSQPYVGEIRQFPGNFAPVGWYLCQGQTLPISENEVLFQLIGTTYGGDGQETFNLPDLSGRVPIHQGTLNGNTYVLGQSAGNETVTLTAQQIPAHSHAPTAALAGGADTPANNTWAESGNAKPYSSDLPTVTMKTGIIGSSGGNQPHNNTVPTVAINYIIAWAGVFPSPSSGSGGDVPFLSQITIFSFNFAPNHWAMCNGQLLPINQNQALFSLLGTTYGGNGTTTFALPNLQGRVPMHVGSTTILGQVGGEAVHTLITAELPAHNHTVKASTGAPDALSPQNNSWASHTGSSEYGTYGGSLTAMSALATTNTGGGQPHNNMAPYLVLTYAITLVGVFPSPN